MSDVHRLPKRWLQSDIVAEAAVIILCVIGAYSANAADLIIGSIVRFECGDNCYLTIKDSRGREIDALCVAPQCQPWNHFAELPRSYIGKTVRVRMGTGKQIDGEGATRGRMRSFEEVVFVGQ